MAALWALLLATCALASGITAVASAQLPLSNWMGALAPALGSSTLLEYSLPGTHDSITYALSDRVADNSNDIPPALSDVLHLLPPDQVTAYLHAQAQSQIANLTAQLNGGVRFVDFRVTWTRGPDNSTFDWYNLHMLESIAPAMVYLGELREWLDAHPSEVVLLWISHHSDSCLDGTDEYPGTTVADRQRLWVEIEELFNGLLFDASVSALNSTSLNDLVHSSQRLVIFAADYADFTNSSRYALDACATQDKIGEGLGVAAMVTTQANLLALFASTASRRANDTRHGQFFQVFGSTSTPLVQEISSALMLLLPNKSAEIAEVCALSFVIPNMTKWCPPRLLDVVQLSNYYMQRVFEYALQMNYSFPNAIYLDCMQSDGTVVTGTDTEGTAHSYPFAATLILATLKRICGASNSSSACTDAIAAVQALRGTAPVYLWDDPFYGRVIDWPPLPPPLKT